MVVQTLCVQLLLQLRDDLLEALPDKGVVGVQVQLPSPFGCGDLEGELAQLSVRRPCRACHHAAQGSVPVGEGPVALWGSLGQTWSAGQCIASINQPWVATPI